jgi:SpoVK/Ycf46/Vps4 family AAA+-type ATPase
MPRKDEKDANFRWRAMAAAAQSLDPATTLLVVDEADAIEEIGPHGKAVLTDLLDASPHCWVFIGNERPFAHEALRRRSSFEIAFPRPDQTFRRRLWQEISKEKEISVSEATLERLARVYPFSPGSIHTVCRDAIRLSRTGSLCIEEVLSEVCRLHADGMGVAQERQGTGPAWREDCLNVQGGIEAPLGRIRTFAARRAAKDPSLQVDRLNVLLSGPPGTGKTEFVKQVAKETGRELFSRTAADILDKYVGGTEKRLKEVFREARDAGGILFLDEIDSLLRDRSGAQRSWEVGQVNQLLQEMDSYQGLFFAATNHVAILDIAAARRFQIKLEFQALRPEQRHLLWESQLAPLMNGASAPKTALSRLESLVPGDFRVVWSQLCLEESCPTVEEVVARLEAEVRSRGGAGRRLGL